MNFDLLHYICPPKGKLYRLAGLGDEHCHCVQAKDGWIEFRKNRHVEEFYVTDTVIGRGADTSLISRDGVHPTGQFYVQFTREADGSLTYGAPWAKRMMSVGESFRRNCHVTNFAFDGRIIDEGTAVTTLTINAHYPSLFFPQSGISVEDVLELKWEGEEVYYYAKGFGLVGWKNLRDPNIQSFIAAFTAAVQEPFPHDARPRPRIRKPPAEPGDSTVLVERDAADSHTFVVVWDEGLWVRANPSMGATRIGEVSFLDRIQVEEDSRTVDEAEGLIWWRHDDGRALAGGGTVDGWTAEKWPAKDRIFMLLAQEMVRHQAQSGAIRQFIPDANDPFDVNNPQVVPLRDGMFERLPVERISWVQHFGNTEFASNNIAFYGYSQRLHGGIDLADTAANSNVLVPVLAGVPKGRVLEPSTHFGPRNVCIRVETGIPGRHYTLIYGHLHPESPLLPKDAVVGPDTKLGHIALKPDLHDYETPPGSGKHPLRGMAPHLHLEIRLTVNGTDFILNPLLFLPDRFCDALARMNASFCNWHKWQTPFDQPVLRRGGPAIGPTAGA